MPQIPIDFTSLDLRPDTNAVTSVKFRDFTAGFPDAVSLKTVDQIKFIDETVSPNTEQIVWAKPCKITPQLNNQTYIDIFRDSTDLLYIQPQSGQLNTNHSESVTAYYGDQLYAKIKVPEGYVLHDYMLEGSGVTYESGNVYVVPLPEITGNYTINFSNQTYSNPTFSNTRVLRASMRFRINNTNALRFYVYCETTATYQHTERDESGIKIVTDYVTDIIQDVGIPADGHVDFTDICPPESGWMLPMLKGYTRSTYFYIKSEGTSGEEIRVSPIFYDQDR